MGRLTKAQAYYLERFLYGWTISHPNRASAPLRRLIARGLIEKTGVVCGRPYFQASDAGRRALTESQQCD